MAQCGSRLVVYEVDPTDGGLNERTMTEKGTIQILRESKVWLRTSQAVLRLNTRLSTQPSFTFLTTKFLIPSKGTCFPTVDMSTRELQVSVYNVVHE